MKLESFISDRWISGAGQARALVNLISGDTIAEADRAIRGSPATFERLARDASEATL